MRNAGGRSTPNMPTTATTVRPRAFTGPPTTSRRLVRSGDQLDIVVELIDAVVDGDQVEPSGPDPAMRLTFGAQHTAERTFPGPAPVPPTTGINHIAAGDSVVVVPITGSFPFTVDGILGAAEATAGLAGRSTEGEPDGSVTALEAPAGIWLSPASPTRLAAARRPFTTADTTEVWTARLERVEGNGALDLAAISHSPDELLETQVPDAAARGDIVKNTTTDAPLAARRLWLTSSGAFADLHGEWTAGLALYDHALAAGRDVHVEVLSLGYLLPFGHRAAIAETSERVFLDDQGGGRTAVMQVEQFLTIVEPEVTTPRAFAQRDGRGLPFASLTATTDETAAIRLIAVDDAAGTEIEGVSDVRARATGADLVVDYRCVDRGGDTVSFALPATFIDDSFAHQTGAADAPARVRQVANAAARLARREVDLGGQRVSYADPLAGSQTSKATRRFRLAWEGPVAGVAEDDLQAARDVAVYGVLEDADVVHEMAGSATGATGATVGVTLHDRWLDGGNDAGDNFDLAFLKLAESVSSLIGGGARWAASPSSTCSPRSTTSRPGSGSTFRRPTHRGTRTSSSATPPRSSATSRCHR